MLQHRSLEPGRSSQDLAPHLARAPSSDLHIPLSNRVLGTAILVVAVASFIGTRSIVVFLPLLGSLILYFAYAERSSVQTYVRVGPIPATFGLLLTYALLSVSWTPAPEDGAAHVLTAMLMLACAHVIATWIGLQQAPRIRHLVFWLVVGFAVGLVWLAFEVLSHQATKRWIINSLEFFKPSAANKHFSFDERGYVWITHSDLNRNIAAANLLLWPVLMCATLLWKGRLRLLVLGTILTAIALATFASDHETSKLALIVSVPVFLLARQSTRLAKVILGAGWIIAVAGVVPIALYAYSDLNLHKADWLQYSARDRIAIWADISERTLNAPVLGLGARATHQLNTLDAPSLTELEPQEERTIGRHPHNVFLQTWFELGAVGAALLALAGGAVLLGLVKVPPIALPFALTTLSTVAFELGFCWDIWQRWFFALLAFSAVILVLSLRFAALETRGAQESPAS